MLITVAKLQNYKDLASAVIIYIKILEEKVMKKFVTSVFVVVSVLSACTVQNQGQSYDEVYYSPKDKSAVAQVNRPILHKMTKDVQVTTDSSYLSEPISGNDNPDNQMAQDSKSLKDGQSYATDNNINNNFNYNDYYDYGYASRIRRFQYGYFNDYYHDYYTNRYWYDYNPGYWGSSIYSNWGMNMGMSYYMDPFSYGSFYSPFSSFYNPFYSPFSSGYYGLGYNMGYNDGYYGYGYGGYGYGGYGYGGYGYGLGYSNIYDHNSSPASGPRKNVSGSNGPTPSERASFNQHYTAFSNGNAGVTSVNVPRNGREVNNSLGTSVNSGLRDKVAGSNPIGMNQRETGVGNNVFGTSNGNVQRPVNTREQLNRNDLNRYISDPVNNPQVSKTDTRSLQQQQQRYFKDRAAGTQNKAVRTNAPVRYAKPTQDAAPQQYYSPANSRPRSSNEYTSPSYRTPGKYNASQQATPQRSVSNPQRYAAPKDYQTPVNNSGTRREVSNFNTRSANTSSPSYSSPSRSTYSAPSQSYSAPASNARESSSGSSSSGSSSGSSSSRPRR